MHFSSGKHVISEERKFLSGKLHIPLKDYLKYLIRSATVLLNIIYKHAKRF